MRGIFLNHGDTRDPKTRHRTQGAQRAATTIVAYPGETIASITQRAYGRNTPELQERLRGANARLVGEVNVPR